MGDSLPNRVPETSACCPTCRYNLTGLTEPRCPECGHRFDVDRNDARGLPLGNILVLLDVFTVMLAGLIVCSSPNPTTGTLIPDSVVVFAMMAPLQLVLISSATMAGMLLLRNGGPRWLAIVGIGLPALAGMVSLTAVI